MKLSYIKFSKLVLTVILPVAFIAACNSGGSVSGNQTTYYIYETNSTYNGNLGGLSGANIKCSSDSNMPSGESGSAYSAAIFNSNPFVPGRTYTLYYSGAAQETFTPESQSYLEMVNGISPMLLAIGDAWFGDEDDGYCSSSGVENPWIQSGSSNPGSAVASFTGISVVVGQPSGWCSSSQHLICVKQ